MNKLHKLKPYLVGITILIISSLTVYFVIGYVLYDSKDRHRIINEADTLCDQGNVDGAIKKYKFCLFFDMDKSCSHYSYTGLARCYALKGDFQKSSYYLRKYIGPGYRTSRKYQFVLGQLYLIGGEYKAAKNVFVKLSKDPDNSVAVKKMLDKTVFLIDNRSETADKLYSFDVDFKAEMFEK